MGAPKNLAGQVFGYLTVIEKTDLRSSSGAIIWRCQCKCGNPVNASTRSLMSGTTKSCGCLRAELLSSRSQNDLTGKIFGRLEAIKKTDQRKNGCVVWECRCECGKLAYVRAANLRSGTTKSCGCYNDELAPKTMRSHVAADRVAGTKLSFLSSTPPSNNTSGVRGVTFHKASGCWAASIGFRGKVIYLGIFGNIDDAIKARRTVEEALWKPFLEDHLGEYTTEEDLREKVRAYLKERISAPEAVVSASSSTTPLPEQRTLAGGNNSKTNPISN